MKTLHVKIKDKTYTNGVRAIVDLDFNAMAGEFVAVVGPSGTGKTTLLNIVAGIDTQFSGEIEQADDGRLSFMFQEPRLMPWLTLEDNIRLVLDAPAMQSDTSRFDRMHTLLKDAGLGDFLEAFPGNLSGGMKRRAALVRAFVTRPDLLLMDEPFQSLDAPNAASLRNTLMQLWEQQRPTVLFVTHSLNEALQLADRVLFLSARPATLVLDYTVPLARPRPEDISQLQPLQDELLATHPGLLSGLLNPTKESPQ